MNQLDEIRASLAPDLKLMEDCIRRQLATGNPMLQTIIDGCLRSKGKQIRPILVFLTARLLSGINDRVVSGAAALELLHNASLIHDDVVDQSSERRGAPTINSVWDNHVAVLAGDFFVSSALQLAIKTGNVAVVETVAGLGKTLSLGELDQIYNAMHGELSEENYLGVITLKTASLFKACARTAADALGVDDERSRALVRFAELLGLCFQMRDDVFDYFSDPAVGKPTGNDLREGKVTLPLLHVLADGSLPLHEAMNALVRSGSLNEGEIETLTTYAKTYGGIEYTYARMAGLRAEGVEALGCLPDTEDKRRLIAIFDYIITRNH
ncbi:MAG: polyprenyl synthetase family protein [Muribaculaceae bacterium]